MMKVQIKEDPKVIVMLRVGDLVKSNNTKSLAIITETGLNDCEVVLLDSGSHRRWNNNCFTKFKGEATISNYK